MALIRGILKSCENLSSFKTWNVLLKNQGNVNFVSSVKKLDIPPPPKRPLTAYMIFCKENRDILIKEMPSLRSTEIIKLLADKWNQLSEGLRKSFENRARESTVLYAEAHKMYYENLTEQQKEDITRMKKEKRQSKHFKKLKQALKENGFPKAPLNSYAIFVQSQALEREGKQFEGFIKDVAKKWKELPEASKEVFAQQAEKDKRLYSSKVVKWRQKMIDNGQDKLLRDYDVSRLAKYNSRKEV